MAHQRSLPTPQRCRFACTGQMRDEYRPTVSNGSPIEGSRSTARASAAEIRVPSRSSGGLLATISDAEPRPTTAADGADQPRVATSRSGVAAGTRTSRRAYDAKAGPLRLKPRYSLMRHTGWRKRGNRTLGPP